MSDIETIGISLILENGVAEGIRHMERDFSALSRKTTLHAAAMQRLVDTHLRTYQASPHHNVAPPWQSSFHAAQKPKPPAPAVPTNRRVPFTPETANKPSMTDSEAVAHVGVSFPASSPEARPQPPEPSTQVSKLPLARPTGSGAGEQYASLAKALTLPGRQEVGRRSILFDTAELPRGEHAHLAQPHRMNNQYCTIGDSEPQTDPLSTPPRKRERPKIMITLSQPASPVAPETQGAVAISLPPASTRQTSILSAAPPNAPLAQAFAGDPGRPRSPTQTPQIAATSRPLFSGESASSPGALKAHSPSALTRFLPLHSLYFPVDYTLYANPPEQSLAAGMLAASIPPAPTTANLMRPADDTPVYKTQGAQIEMAKPAPPASPPSLPQPRALEPTGSTIQGDLLIDGAIMGNWLARTLAHQATRPGTGARRFNARLSPAWPGMPL